MYEREARTLKTLEDYACMLLGDVVGEEMCLQPTAGSNHAAWIIGHLAYASDRHGQYAGAIPELDKNWEHLFGMGSTPTGSPNDYPAKDKLIQAWLEANARLVTAANAAGPELLGKPTLGPLVSTLPTVGDFLTFSMTGHTATHIGQLSAWRRAIGRPTLF